MLSDDKADLVRRRFEALDRGNFDVLDELFSPEYELHPGATSEALSLDQTKALYRSLYDAFPDLEHTIERQLVDGDRVVTLWIASGTHRNSFLGAEATGSRVTFSGINVYTVADGKFIRSDVSWDLLPVLRQLDISPRRDSLFDLARGGRDGEAS